MNGVNNIVQCWGCPIFDKLFQIVSAAGAAMYEHMVVFAWIALVAFWAFYALWVVYLNFKDKEAKDWLYQESVKPVLINSLIIAVFLGMGTALPKLVGSLTFEPVADVTAIYAEAVLQVDAAKVAQRVKYQPEPMVEDGFFRVELRDKIIHLMKISVTQFQSMIRLGLVVMENAISFKALLGVVNLLKHILMLFLGLYLVYTFFRLFLRFCFYFVDVIVALTFFAFFFPFMAVFFVFKHSSAADWVKNMGKEFTPGLIKNVINTIVALVVAIVTYLIVMVIIAKFFASDAMSSNEIVLHVLNGTVSKDILYDDNLVNLTVMGAIVIGFIANFLVSQIPNIGKEVFEAFGVKPDDKLSKEVFDSVEGMIKSGVGQITTKIKDTVTGKKEEEKKEEKKES